MHGKRLDLTLENFHTWGSDDAAYIGNAAVVEDFVEKTLIALEAKRRQSSRRYRLCIHWNTNNAMATKNRIKFKQYIQLLTNVRIFENIVLNWLTNVQIGVNLRNGQTRFDLHLKISNISNANLKSYNELTFCESPNGPPLGFAPTSTPFVPTISISLCLCSACAAKSSCSHFQSIKKAFIQRTLFLRC